jgi:hypothetical protein
MLKKGHTAKTHLVEIRDQKVLPESLSSSTVSQAKPEQVNQTKPTKQQNNKTNKPRKIS